MVGKTDFGLIEIKGLTRYRQIINCFLVLFCIFKCDRKYICPRLRVAFNNVWDAILGGTVKSVLDYCNFRLSLQYTVQLLYTEPSCTALRLLFGFEEQKRCSDKLKIFINFWSLGHKR